MDHVLADQQLLFGRERREIAQQFFDDRSHYQ
jgi:hypothetical protein